MGNWFKVILLLKLNELEVFSQNKKQESNHRRPSPLPLSLVEFFYEHSERLKAVDNFCKKAPPKKPSLPFLKQQSDVKNLWSFFQ